MAALADLRGELDKLHENNNGYLERATALPTMGLCPADDLVAQLTGLADYWFSPAVVDAIYGQIAARAGPLTQEAIEIAQQISAGAARLNDPAKTLSLWWFESG